MRHQFATIHELARIEMLAGLPGETLGKLAERMERRELQPGEVVLPVEAGSARFCVVLSGMLTGAGGALLRPGDTAGGLTLFEEPLRAMTPAVVATCDASVFEDLIRPALGA